jgi:Sec-independent protein translocase protein TatA
MSVMGIGPLELVVVMVIAYLVLGPERMTTTVRSLAKVVRDLKEQTAGFPKTLDEFLQPPPDDDEAEEPQTPGVPRPRRTRASKAPEDESEEPSSDDSKVEE